MLNEPGTLPKRSSSRLAYGALAAVFTILFQQFGRVEQTFAFALLLTNVFSFTLDRYSRTASAPVKEGLPCNENET